MGIDPLKGTRTVRPLLALVRKRTQLTRELRHVTVTSEEHHITLNMPTMFFIPFHETLFGILRFYFTNGI